MNPGIGFPRHQADLRFILFQLLLRELGDQLVVVAALARFAVGSLYRRHVNGMLHFGSTAFDLHSVVLSVPAEHARSMFIVSATIPSNQVHDASPIYLTLKYKKGIRLDRRRNWPVVFS
jgi:hypothetical protein